MMLLYLPCVLPSCSFCGESLNETITLTYVCVHENNHGYAVICLYADSILYQYFVFLYCFVVNLILYQTEYISVG